MKTFRKRKDLHPLRRSPTRYETKALASDPPHLELTLDSLLQAARSATQGSAQRISGWRYEHIRFFLPGDGSGGGGTARQCALFIIAQQLAAGNAPPSLLRLLASGRFFTLNKDLKGNKVRPITMIIGDVLRRWVTKAILIKYGKKFEEHLGALQYVVGLVFLQPFSPQPSISVSACPFQRSEETLSVRVKPRWMWRDNMHRPAGQGGGSGGGEQMKDAFCSLLQGLYHCYVTKEPMFGQLGLSTATRLVEKRQKRPDFLARLPSGDTVLADVAVTYPFSIDANHLRRFAKTAGSAARGMKKVKNDRYGEICYEIGFRFVPLVFETYGRPGEGVVRVLKEVAKLGAGRMRGREGDEAVQARLMNYYSKLLSCTLQRFVTANLLSSIYSKRGTRGHFQPKGLLGGEVAAFSRSFDQEGAN
uniref:Uncharacterized protein n=1 Tax=Chromera velia CCMP2878 TaxID=1169474 RepID=A0A0G4FDF8_9ALVE|eukprot:Cvel_16482.t1-p1 / transcript=Cvel_16482.t1 / gene=Cvel_16482 / organism=Chromera_velia_CCMP2878 / gene_product=hypothetical protein / transcript_product=hypothetical protein / location=Cvel_scaffold1270:43350-45943(+) / protein_length=418 / sequence_SO=supercontig / SO=protein_coding / is_pseudo=false